MPMITVTLEGVSPLMVNSARGLNPLDELTREVKALGTKRKKTDEDTLLLLKTKFEQSLYYDRKLGPYLPAFNIRKCAIEAARKSKRGTAVQQGVAIVGDERLPLKYDGPRDPQKMWEAGFADIRAAWASGRGIQASRALFREWSVEATFNLDYSVIEEQEFLSYLVLGGRIIGVGTYRDRFGRFTVWQSGAEIGDNGKPLTLKAA